MQASTSPADRLAILLSPTQRARLARAMEPQHRQGLTAAAGCRALARLWHSAAGRPMVLEEDQAVSFVLDTGLARTPNAALAFLHTFGTATYPAPARWWHLGGLLADPGEYGYLSLVPLLGASGVVRAWRLESGFAAL